MKLQANTIITILFCLAIFIWVASHLWKAYKEGRKPTPDDEIYQLRWKIECCEINDHNELYLINALKEMKAREDLDKKKLEKLDIMLRERFQELHIEDIN